MRYVINYSDNDQTIELPEDATFELDSVAAGGEGGHITVLTIFQGDKTLAVFVGAMRIYPVSFEPAARTWAR